MELHTLSGSLGTGIVVAGYIFQIARLVRTHRGEGVSGRTYLLWAIASGLLLVHAMGMRSVVFTVLMVFQILGCILIATLATLYRRLESPADPQAICGRARRSALSRDEAFRTDSHGDAVCISRGKETGVLVLSSTRFMAQKLLILSDVPLSRQRRGDEARERALGKAGPLAICNWSFAATS
jgi:hypothetical protein